MKRRFFQVSTFVIVLAYVLVSRAVATPSAGSDMWTGGMAIVPGLFTPHADYCDPFTEAFVEIVFGLGFCIERNERPAQKWRDARHTCLKELKRLPEVAEYQFACDNSVTLGISGMMDNREWSSNFFIETLDSNNAAGVHAAGGIISCDIIVASSISSSGAGPSSHPFRCVR